MSGVVSRNKLASRKDLNGEVIYCSLTRPGECTDFGSCQMPLKYMSDELSPSPTPHTLFVSTMSFITAQTRLLLHFAYYSFGILFRLYARHSFCVCARLCVSTSMCAQYSTTAVEYDNDLDTPTPTDAGYFLSFSILLYEC